MLRHPPRRTRMLRSMSRTENDHCSTGTAFPSLAFAIGEPQKLQHNLVGQGPVVKSNAWHVFASVTSFAGGDEADQRPRSEKAKTKKGSPARPGREAASRDGVAIRSGNAIRNHTKRHGCDGHENLGPGLFQGILFQGIRPRDLSTSRPREGESGSCSTHRTKRSFKKRSRSDPRNRLQRESTRKPPTPVRHGAESIERGTPVQFRI